MARRILFLLPFFWILLGLVPKTLVSVNVGRVGDQIITSREVQINHFVEMALFGPGLRSGREIKMVKPQDPSFIKEVNGVLIEWVVFLESMEFSDIASKSGDLVASMARIKKWGAQSPDFAALQATEQEMESLVRRKHKAKEMIRFKVNSSVVPISEKEARDYYERNRDKFTGPFDKVRASIMSYLEKQQVDRRLRDWFSVLQVKYKVRQLPVDFNGSPQPRR